MSTAPGKPPRRPSGTGAHAVFAKWVWDSLVSGGVAEAEGGEETGIARVRQYILTDRQGHEGEDGAQYPDYFICRPYAISAAEEIRIGETDHYIAKPAALRRNLFDRDFINTIAPGEIGTPNEISYDVPVETWDGATLTVETRRFSYEYKTATFRIATDMTEEDPDDWTSENQTIIPRFVPALLIEVEGDPVTTDTINPTLIYAVGCGGMGMTRNDIPILSLAINDSWAWAKTR